MKQTIANLMLGSGLALSFSGIAADLVAGPKLHDAINEQVSDARHEMEILTALDRNPRLHAFDFSVSVDVGTAVLGGTVDNLGNKDLAETIAIGMDGIKSVVNHIVVEASYMRARHES